MERFTISLDESLARQFDQLIAGRGYSNRSEAVRDLIRGAPSRATGNVRRRPAGEAIANDPGAAVKRWHDQILQMSGAGGERQQQLADRRHRFIGAGQKQCPDLFGTSGASWLARGDNIKSLLRASLQAGDLRSPFFFKRTCFKFRIISVTSPRSRL